MRTLIFALRRLRRGFASGELLILALALAIAVASASAVQLFSARVAAGIAAQSGDTLGGDLLYSSRDPLTDDFSAQLQAAGLRLIPLVQFPSVVRAGEASTLAGIKAVTAQFPLRGRLTVAAEPYGAARLVHGGPARGEAWVDARLWQELSLPPHATLQVGALQLRVTGVVVEEPGRAVGMLDLAPRLMMNLDDIPASHLLTSASRAEYMLLATGAPGALARAQELKLPLRIRLRTPQEARPEIKQAMGSAGEFLGLAQLAASLLAAAAIAVCAWQHGEKLRDEVALLKCLGARSGFILLQMTLQLVLLGLVASAVGALTGLAVQEAIASMLASLLRLELPPPPLAPLLQASALALLLLLGFALPPLLAARRAPPVRVFQRDAGATPSRLPLVIGTAATLALLWSTTGDLQAAGYVLGGAAVMLAVLAGAAWLLVLGTTPLRRAGQARARFWLRFGLANLSRRRGATVAQSAALGLALLALLLVSLLRQDLLQLWRDRLPANTPNQFLIGIQTEQLDAVKQFFADRGFADLAIMPMARGRLTAINGRAITPDMYEDAETQRWLNREMNLSWTDVIGPDNRLVDGSWWGEAGRGQPWLSVDKYAIERLKLQLGDRLTLDFAGSAIELTLHNVREVQWDSFKPNFFLLVPEGVIDPALVPTQWLTSFYLPSEKRALLRELVQAFPNVSPLDIEAVMLQVRAVIDRIASAVELIFLFTLAAGIAVLLAAIEGTRGQRMRETALLRTLGASARTITLALAAEYAVLGLVAGLVAAAAAQTLGSVLAAQVFHLAYGPRPILWIAGGGGGAVLVALLGWLSLRSALNTAPRSVLAGS